MITEQELINKGFIKKTITNNRKITLQYVNRQFDCVLVKNGNGFIPYISKKVLFWNKISKMDKNSYSLSILKGIRSGSIFYLYKGKSKVFYVPYLTRSFNAGSQYYVPAKMVVDLQQLDDLLQEIKNGNII